MKLKHVLAIAFLFISVVPLFLSLQYLNIYTAQQYRAQIADKLSALSLIAKKRIISVLDRVEDNTALIANRTQMRLNLKSWNETYDSIHQQNITRIINDAMSGISRIYQITIYDTNGNIVSTTSTTNSHTENLDITEVNSDIKLLKVGEQLFLENMNSLSLDNNIIGYIKVTFSADFVLEMINDRSGLGTTGEWLFSIRAENGDALFAIPLKYDRDAAFNRTISKDRIDIPTTQALQGNEIIMQYTPDYIEQPVLASTRYIPEQDWGLVVKINESEVDELILDANRIIYILQISIIILSLIISAILSFYIARPLEKLRAHTKKVAKGIFEPHAVSKAWREVQDLTDSFNEMIKSLKSLNDERDRQSSELKHSNEALERSNIELQRFSYVASHDLKTPMRTIASFIGLLKSTYHDKFDDQGKDWLLRIENAIVQLQNLIRDLLEYSRVDSSAKPFMSVSLNDVFNQAVSLLEVSIQEAGAKITQDDLPSVIGDQSQLVQLMLNLIENGIKYRSTEAPRIHVSAELKNNEWEISVQDNGIGISQKHQDRIFEIFKRLHHQEEYPGSGIGLAVCRRVVHRHGGSIWVTSEAGKGSTFIFTLRVKKE